MAVREEMEVVKPIIFEVNETGEEFTLEFNRSSVMYSEKHGFNIDRLDDSPYSGIVDLFYFSFRMHHPKVDRTKAEHILFDILGGMPEGWVERLGKLYALPFESLLNKEDNEKNSKVTIRQ